MSMRASREELQQSAERALAQALAETGQLAVVGDMLQVAGQNPIPLQVIAANRISVPLRHDLTAEPSPHQIRIVVADAISTAARRALDAADVNWLDRRGHLRLVAPGIFINTAIDAQPRSSATDAHPADPIRGRAGLAIALDGLLRAADGEVPSRVTHIARTSGLSQPAISIAARPLRQASLISPEGVQLPELFWEVVAVWNPRWTNLTSIPSATPATPLFTGGTLAAIHHGAPIVATNQYAIELYTADDRTYQIVQARHCGDGPTVARIAMAPTPVALTASATPTDTFGWVHPVVAALDLAIDRGRGREVLEAWTPLGFRRVW